MEYLFSPDNWEWVITDNNARVLFEAFLVNLEIALISIVLSLILGLTLALLCITPSRAVRLPAKLWVDVFRNLPLIFLILYLYLQMPFGLDGFWEDNAPGFLPDALQTEFVVAGILGLTLYNSAVLAEIMRSGILSLPRGQREAAASLGMSYAQQMRIVVLPQGLRRMVPATVSQLITLTKDTTLVSIITIQEVTRTGRQLTNTAGNPFAGGGVDAPILHVMIFVGVLFVIVNYSLSRLSRRLEVKTDERTAVKSLTPAQAGLARPGVGGD